MEKIKIDQNLCIGCGLCSTIAPKAFKMGRKGKAEVVWEGESPAKIKEAITSCPVGAISQK